MDEKRIIKTIKKVMPAVVSIVVSKHLEDLEKEIPSDLYPFLPGTKNGKKLEIPDELVDKDGLVQVGGGSGFIVEPNGIVVTNKHVLSDPKADYTLVTGDGVKHRAEILSRDPINDVAILRIDGQKLPYVPLGTATDLELGQSVIAIGNALGLFKDTVSSGIVSGLSRAVTAQSDPEAPPQEMRGLIQTDAAINPGNSGGPLVDLKGRAVGINAAVIFGAQNISFAIPIDSVKRDLEDIKKFGHIRRPLLGVRYVIVNDKIQNQLSLPVNYGALVTKETSKDHGVVPGSPAEKAGLMEKDIILECNSIRVDTEHPIQDVLETMNVGDDLNMKVIRNGEEINLKVVLAERK